MYQTYDETAILQLLGIETADKPDLLIVHGTYNMPDKLAAWLAREGLANPRVAKQAFNLGIAQYTDHTVWYAPVLGAPMAAFVTHCACQLGVKRIMQIGTYGGTRRGAQAGDLLLVTGAERGEAASDWYLPQGAPALADLALSETLRVQLRRRQLTWHEGTVYTTPAFMAERWEDILRWEAAGHAGVEMEAATVLAIAQHFHVPACCLLTLLDNLIEEQDLAHMSKADRDRVRQQRGVLIDVAMSMAMHGCC